MVFDSINNNRLIVARRAADFIMEEGITDYLFAKKKAAKSLGLLTSDNLPSNQEIDNALKEYQNIFQEEVDSTIINKIKEEALNTMVLFEDFNPHLTGQLLEGLIPKFPKIQINLFTDNIKEVEYTLLNNNIAFDVKDTIYQEKLSKKKSTKTIPAFMGEVDILKCAPIFPAHGAEQGPLVIELVITGDIDKPSQRDLGIRTGFKPGL